MPIRLPFLCVLLIVSTSAFPQEAPIVDCDRYAASDLDPQRKATGVPPDQINPSLAVPACEDAVRQYPNSTRLILQLGRAYEKGNDFTAAVVQYRKAAEQNFAAAQSALGLMYFRGQGVPQDYQKAVAWFRKAADQGLAEAETNLGVMYRNGWGVPKDDKEAIEWYRLAVAQGDARALTNLGFMYDKGLGVPKNYDEAMKLYRLAAEQAYAPAQYNLGIMYKKGRGVPKNDKEAIKWFQSAAALGNAQAQADLGVMYQNGWGVPKDYGEALRLYRLAAEQRYAGAQNNLGFMYQSGWGVPKNDKEAIKWYRLAVAQGNAQAQANLGSMYEYGRGVPKDYGEAVKLYRLAVAQGDALAQTNLGFMYADGLGVPKDYVLSFMWLIISNGEGASLFETIASKMTPAQIELAQKMAKRCEESNYEECGETQGDQFNVSTTSVPMQMEGGTYVVPVLINDAITLNFVVDSGAADVAIPADVVMTLMRTGTLKESDFLGEKTYILADGSKVPSQTFRIRSLKVGNKILENVTGSVATVQGSLLLGQSFLSRFKSWSIDNAKHALLLSE
jgi:TPR repeat protein/predicted aspartyl protease